MAKSFPPQESYVKCHQLCTQSKIEMAWVNGTVEQIDCNRLAQPLKDKCDIIKEGVDAQYIINLKDFCSTPQRAREGANRRAHHNRINVCQLECSTLCKAYFLTKPFNQEFFQASVRGVDLPHWSKTAHFV